MEIMRSNCVIGVFLLISATTVACSRGTVGSPDLDAEISRSDNAPVEMIVLSETPSPEDDSLESDEEVQVKDDSPQVDETQLVDSTPPPDTSPDGAQQQDLSEAFDDTATIETIENSDTNATDAIWAGCEVIGPYCAHDDTVIFTTYCYNVPGEVERWPVYAACGQQCECGYVVWTTSPPDPLWMVPCEETTSPEIPYPAAQYCATGKRVLCAEPTVGTSDTRVGCCDADGRIHCEWNPVPDGNRCIEG